MTQGDILQADAEALVNTVNCVGVMGRGIALQFKKRFPDNFKHYKAVCDKKELQPGKMFINDLNRLYNPRYVVNFPTKRHWKGKSRMEDIESGLQALVADVRKRDIRSIAIPPHTIEDDWIESVEKLEEMMDEYIHLRQQAHDVFEMRYQTTIDPDRDRWELCSRVLARRDVVDRLSVPW